MRGCVFFEERSRVIPETDARARSGCAAACLLRTCFSSFFLQISKTPTKTTKKNKGKRQKINYSNTSGCLPSSALVIVVARRGSECLVVGTGLL